MLATASSGAIWSSCSPDFGVQGVLDRFGQIEPKVLFAADGYCYDGKTIDSCDACATIAARAADASSASWSCRTSQRRARRSRAYRDARRCSTSGSRSRARSSRSSALPFDHPLYILYSSGTTGVPKCIVHGAGGTLLQHLKEHVLHTRLKPRRPPVLLHDLRLDDVELARVGARVAARRSCSTTARRSIPTAGVLCRLRRRASA